jgi:hypothetical protein
LGSGRVAILVLLFFLSLTLNPSHLLPFTIPVNALTSPTTLFVSTPSGSNNITDLVNTQKTVTFNVDVSLSPSINAFLVFISYNTTIFSVASVDYSNNVLGSGAQLQRLCIDNLKRPNLLDCQPPDSQGVVSIALYTLGNQSSPATTNGQLFSVTLNVIGTGLGQIHILSGDSLLNGAGSVRGYVPFKSQDGYYTNLACPQNSGVPCKPPMVTITVSPPAPSLGSVAAFNATVIVANVNAIVQSYVWDWGDGTTASIQSSLSTAKHAFKLNPFGSSGPCITNGACPVTVTVLDSDGVSWKTTIVVTILHLAIKIAVSDLTVDHQFNSVPGTQIHISAKIHNRSTIAEKANLTIFLDGNPINSRQFSLNASGSQFGTSGQLGVDWNTSGLAPRAYAVTVSVCRQHCLTTDPLSSQSGIVSAQTVGGRLVYGLNDTSESSQTSYVVLIVPQVLGAFSLGLLQTAGLGILIIAAAVLGFSRFLRKPSYETKL